MPAPTSPTGLDPASIATVLRHNQRLLSVKELAWHLNRHPNYVYLMRKAGFPMPGNRTTLEAALAWLQENPTWRRDLA
jgi:hypothetical protein